MKTEYDILIEIAVLELQLSHALKENILHEININILKIKTQIDTLKWVLEK